MKDSKFPYSSWITSATILYLTFAFLYFKKNFNIPGKTAFPTIILSIFLPLVYTNSSKLILAALFFSAIGDVCGYLKKTPLQLLFFGFAHSCYIAYFIPYATKSVMARCFFTIGIIGALIGFVVFMYPHINDIVLRYGMIIYSSIVFMMVLSIFLFTGECKVGFIIASLLFMLSDVSIAVNRFVIEIPYQKYLIMITYYSAQFMFWYFSLMRTIMLDSSNNSNGTNEVIVKSQIDSIGEINGVI